MWIANPDADEPPPFSPPRDDRVLDEQHEADEAPPGESGPAPAP